MNSGDRKEAGVAVGVFFFSFFLSFLFCTEKRYSKIGLLKDEDFFVFSICGFIHLCFISLFICLSLVFLQVRFHLRFRIIILIIFSL